MHTPLCAISCAIFTWLDYYLDMGTLFPQDLWYGITVFTHDYPQFPFSYSEVFHSGSE